MKKLLLVAFGLLIAYLVVAKSIQTIQITQKKSCGGFAGETGDAACPSGFVCKYEHPEMYDVQGKCQFKVLAPLFN